MALEASLPSSFIYVFTDARAKDYHLEDQILNLIQEKQSSVVFVMTGDCNDRSHPGFRCYEKIAAVSFGQVFHLEKTDVNKVLNYVRHSIAMKMVHILYEVRDKGGSTLRQIPVDKSLNELTLSLSGDKDDGDYLDISLINPKGARVDRNQFGDDTGSIDLHNIKLIRIRDPMPGIWHVRTSSRLKHTLRVLGHGAIDFKYGFATKPVEKVEMPATRHLQNPYLFYIGPFIPPQGHYFVRVKGEDDGVYEFQRIAPTALSPVDAGGPRAYMADRITAVAAQPVNLTCSVASKGEFTLYWYRGREKLGGPLFYP
ncbi:unnamed protein product [Gongylonema pulchrum]|uniref:Ig-like domain-containing protein n=1 Tax=Gongylonema pulchrum TaxID=637853 RepID=A0A3P6PP32_9BILA|nr:unnamed protein product [Gongylonema pulchrum]